MTAEKPENSIFSADEYDITEFQEAEEEFSTAVTVIASPEIKAALKSGNVSALQNFAPPQNYRLNHINGQTVSSMIL